MGMDIATIVAISVAAASISLHVILILLTPSVTPSTPSESTYTTTPKSAPSPLPSLSDPPSRALSVIVPAYNEDDRLGIMIDEAMEYFLSSQPKWKKHEKDGEEGVEILVIDDGSNDKTTRTAQLLAEKWAARMKETRSEGQVEIEVVTLARNRGKGGAVQHGVIHSRGALVLFADADGATRFSDLDDLLSTMEQIRDKTGHGIVVGSRAHLVNSDAVVKRSKLRNALMHGFHFFLRTLGVRGIRDTQCGFKLFTRPTASFLFPSLHLHRWSFDVELLLLASLVRPPIPVLEVPVAWHEVNGSKIRLGWDSIGMARDLLVLRGNLFTSRWTVPFRKPPKYDPAKYVNGVNGVSGVGPSDKLKASKS